MRPATVDTPLVPHPGKLLGDTLVGKKMKDEFKDEETTKPEVTETLVETLERLRARTSTRDRPAIRSKTPTETPQ